MSTRSKVAVVVAEFLGTAALASVILPLIQFRMFPWFAAVAAGITLTVMVLTIGRISGAHINPAVTIGMWTIRKVGTLMAIAMIASQFLGGLVAWRLNEYFTGASLKNIANANFDWKVFTAEAVGTFIFTFGIAAAVTQKLDGYQKAFAVGFSLTVGILIASVASNGVLNPAVALGIQSFSAAYVVGPIVGSIIGMNVYQMLMAPEESFKETYGTMRRPSRKAVPAPAEAAKTSTSSKSSSAKSAAKKSPAKRGRKPASSRKK